MKEMIKKVLPVVDIILMPFVYPAGWLLKNIRRAGVQKLPHCKNALSNIGVFPIRSHYYEPQFDSWNSKIDFSQDRILPGIEWNVSRQIELIKSFTATKELLDVPQEKTPSLKFHLNNGSFESGDAEYWYQIIRKVKPNKIFEVGSGNSTLLAIDAIKKTRRRIMTIDASMFALNLTKQLGLRVLAFP